MTSTSVTDFCIVFLITIVIHFVTIRGLSLGKDLQTLSEILPGIYSNSKELVPNATKSHKRHVLLKIVIHPIQVAFLPDSFNVFVEQYYGTESTLHRQRLQSFSVDKTHRAIRLKTFRFLNATMAMKLSKNYELFQDLKKTDVVTQSSCDMFWRRLKKKMFIGITKRGCHGTIRRESVRISVSTTLTPSTLTTHEGWYNLKDGSKVTDIEIPYSLLKIKEINESNSDTQLQDVTLKRSSRHLQPVQNNIPRKRFKTNQLSNNVNHKDKHLYGQKLKTFLHAVSKSSHAWSLRNYRSLLDALTSGRAVNFRMDLSGCALPDQAKIERTSFGDTIDVFKHIIKNRRRRKEFVTFTQRKFQQSSRGYESVVKEVMVFRNGKVVVRLRMTQPDRVPITYAASCSFYNYGSQIGDIKFSTNPSQTIRRIKTYGFLKSSLKKGRRVRMYADLSKCSGSDPSILTEIGGELRGYDYINFEKGIEFSMDRPEIGLSRGGVFQRFLLVRVLHTGDVIITDLIDEHVNSLNQNLQHFKCSMKQNGFGNKLDSSVKFYYL